MWSLSAASPVRAHKAQTSMPDKNGRYHPTPRSGSPRAVVVCRSHPRQPCTQEPQKTLPRVTARPDYTPRQDAPAPKSGSDYIGGNYVGAINFVTTLPQILENSQNIDFSIFLDSANVWGVDYDSSINDSNKIRSSFGIALDWLTAIGPLNFSLSQPITKSSTDKEEVFRFNLGTTF